MLLVEAGSPSSREKWDPNAEVSLAQAFSVREENEFYPIQHLVERLKTKAGIVNVVGRSRFLPWASLRHNDDRRVLAGIRADQQLKGIPVVILTGLVVQEAAREAESLRVAGFMTKPLCSGQFAAVMTSIRQSRSANVTLPSLDRSQSVESHSGDGDGVARQLQLVAASAGGGGLA